MGMPLYEGIRSLPAGNPGNEFVFEFAAFKTGKLLRVGLDVVVVEVVLEEVGNSQPRDSGSQEFRFARERRFVGSPVARHHTKITNPHPNKIDTILISHSCMVFRETRYGGVKKIRRLYVRLVTDHHF